MYLKAYANAVEARRELGAYFRFYNDQRPHQALGYRTPAEVFHGEREVWEESSERRCSPGTGSVVLAGALDAIRCSFSSSAPIVLGSTLVSVIVTSTGSNRSSIFASREFWSTSRIILGMGSSLTCALDESWMTSIPRPLGENYHEVVLLTRVVSLGAVNCDYAGLYWVLVWLVPLDINGGLSGGNLTNFELAGFVIATLALIYK